MKEMIMSVFVILGACERGGRESAACILANIAAFKAEGYSYIMLPHCIINATQHPGNIGPCRKIKSKLFCSGTAAFDGFEILMRLSLSKKKSTPLGVFKHAAAFHKEVITPSDVTRFCCSKL